MNPSTRLRVSAIMIILSAIYAVLVAEDPSLASAVAVGYVGIILTGIILTNVWKRA